LLLLQQVLLLLLLLHSEEVLLGCDVVLCHGSPTASCLHVVGGRHGTNAVLHVVLHVALHILLLLHGQIRLGLIHRPR
jgi:hypothetical protein